MAKKAEGRFSPELLDQLLSGCDPKTVLASGGLVGQLKKALAERMLSAEMDVHLEAEAQAGLANHRNGSSSKTVLTPDGSMDLSIPRDREGRFDPALIAKYRRRLPGFDDKIVALYARGMSTRDIQAHVQELYGIEISPDLVSAVTDSVLDEVAAWQARPLESTYAVVFFDALRVKIRDEGLVRNKAVHLAIGIHPSGQRDVLGLWIEQTEGAKFWLRVMTELKARGTQDILIALWMGLKASLPPSRPSSRKRWCRLVSCICCATRCSSSHPRTAPKSAPSCGRFIAHLQPKPRVRRWLLSNRGRGDASTPRSLKAGGETGKR